MFSGIVEEMATVKAITQDQENINLTLSCSFTHELKIDQSVSHNGVCLDIDINNIRTSLKSTVPASLFKLIT